MTHFQSDFDEFHQALQDASTAFAKASQLYAKLAQQNQQYQLFAPFDPQGMVHVPQPVQSVPAAPERKTTGKLGRPSKPRKRDPAAPKRPMTGYLLFGNSIRNELIAEMEGSSMTQITEEIGRRWSALPDAEKEPFLEQAKVYYEQYRNARETYRATQAPHVELPPHLQHPGEDPDAEMHVHAHQHPQHLIHGHVHHQDHMLSGPPQFVQPFGRSPSPAAKQNMHRLHGLSPPPPMLVPPSERMTHHPMAGQPAGMQPMLPAGMEEHERMSLKKKKTPEERERKKEKKREKEKKRREQEAAALKEQQQHGLAQQQHDMQHHSLPGAPSADGHHHAHHPTSQQ